MYEDPSFRRYWKNWFQFSNNFSNAPLWENDDKQDMRKKYFLELALGDLYTPLTMLDRFHLCQLFYSAEKIV